MITVVGDVKADDVKRAHREGARRLDGAADRCRAFDYPAPPAPKATTIYLVDKPGAAQSTFALGEVGPPRNTPDYYALRVMNEMLGVLFQSRLNHNIREVKGYSYGVGSSFAFGRGPGPFRAGGDIVTAKSDSALIEFMKELQRHSRPASADRRRAGAGEGESRAESAGELRVGGGVNGSIASIYTQGLPEDYYQQFATRGERGDERRRRARRAEVHRSRSPGDRDRRRPREDRRPARGDEDRADRAARRRMAIRSPTR